MSSLVALGAAAAGRFESQLALLPLPQGAAAPRGGPAAASEAWLGLAGAMPSHASGGGLWMGGLHEDVELLCIRMYICIGIYIL